MPKLISSRIISALLVAALCLLGIAPAPMAVAAPSAIAATLPALDPAAGPATGTPEGYYYQGVDPTLATLTKGSEQLSQKYLIDHDIYDLDLKTLTPGTLEHFLKRWTMYKGKWSFERWRDAYITIIENQRKGMAFEKFVFEKFGLDPTQWRTNARLPAELLEKSRPYDITNTYDKGGEVSIPPVGDRVVFELKSGSTLNSHARAQFKKNLVDLAKAGSELVLIFGSEPTPETVAWINKALEGYSGPPVTVRYLLTVGVPESTQPTGSTINSEAIAESFDNPQDQAEFEQVSTDILGDIEGEQGGPNPVENPTPQPGGTPAGDLGGIDFTSLELRYVTDSVNGNPVNRYAFRTGSLPDGAPSFGGRRNAAMATDALNVWLALSPEKFWVNLHPYEPDRIIDPAFGRTQAGQVLLEADLEMKEASGRMQRSDTELGRKFMEVLQGENKCFLGRRQWIEPLPASIHEDGDQLYILEIPLTVQLGKEDSDVSPGQSCPDQDPAITTSNGELYEKMIMPAVVQSVNHDPEFADLRRVYASRVAAEWYRKRNAIKPNQYAKQIDSGNVDKWTTDWDQREVFDRFVTSFNNAKPIFTWQTKVGDVTWTHNKAWGGVDFFKVELNDVGPEKFAQDYPDLAAVARAPLAGITTVKDQNWLGGGTVVGDPAQLWPMQVTPWTPFQIPTPAPQRVLFYLAILTPVAVWGAVGGTLIWRRRRAGRGI